MPPLLVDADARPDWRILDAVVADIGAGLQAGHDGERRDDAAGRHDARADRAGARGGAAACAREDDFFTVFSPERVFSGRVFRDLETYPKLVGGLSEAGEARGVELYARVPDGAEVWPMGSAEAAELTKLAETTYRDVNIAFANELARFADARGLDVDRVIDAANCQPFSHIHRPGIAVGGHCIPVYPRFYLEGDPDARLPARGARGQRGDARLRRRRCLAAALGGSLAGAARPDPRRRLPRRRQGDGLQRRLRAARRARSPRGAEPPSRPTRSTTTPSCAALGLRRRGTGAPVDAADPAGRPRRLRARWARDDLPGRARGRRRARAARPGARFAGAGVALRAPRRAPERAQRAVASAATTRAPAWPSP